MFRCSLRAVFGPPGQGRVCPGCRRWWPSRGLRPALNVSLFMSPLPSLRSFPPSATLTLTLSHQNILRSWTARQRTRCTFAPSSFEGPAGSTDHEAVSLNTAAFQDFQHFIHFQSSGLLHLLNPSSPVQASHGEQSSTLCRSLPRARCPCSRRLAHANGICLTDLDASEVEADEFQERCLAKKKNARNLTEALRSQPCPAGHLAEPRAHQQIHSCCFEPPTKIC